MLVLKVAAQSARVAHIHECIVLCIIDAPDMYVLEEEVPLCTEHLLTCTHTGVTAPSMSCLIIQQRVHGYIRRLIGLTAVACMMTEDGTRV